MTETTKRSVVLRGRRTAVSLEDPFWKELRRITRGLEISTAEFIADFAGDRHRLGKTGSLSNALRVYIFEDVRARASGVAAPRTAAEPLERLQ